MREPECFFLISTSVVCIQRETQCQLQIVYETHTLKYNKPHKVHALNLSNYACSDGKRPEVMNEALYFRSSNLQIVIIQNCHLNLKQMRTVADI